MESRVTPEAARTRPAKEGSNPEPTRSTRPSTESRVTPAGTRTRPAKEGSNPELKRGRGKWRRQQRGTATTIVTVSRFRSNFNSKDFITSSIGEGSVTPCQCSRFGELITNTYEYFAITNLLFSLTFHDEFVHLYSPHVAFFPNSSPNRIVPAAFPMSTPRERGKAPPAQKRGNTLSRKRLRATLP